MIAALLNFFANSFSATKIILTTLFMIILPVVLWNLWIEISEFLLSVALSFFSSFSFEGQSFVFSFSSVSSLASWLATQLRLQEAFVAFVSSLAVRITVDLVMKFLLR